MGVWYKNYAGTVDVHYRTGGMDTGHYYAHVAHTISEPVDFLLLTAEPEWSRHYFVQDYVEDAVPPPIGMRPRKCPLAMRSLSMPSWVIVAFPVVVACAYGLYRQVQL